MQYNYKKNSCAIYQYFNFIVVHKNAITYTPTTKITENVPKSELYQLPPSPLPPPKITKFC